MLHHSHRRLCQNKQHIKELEFIDLTKVASVSEEVSGDYVVKWMGPKRWGVKRKADNAVIQSGLHSEQNATDWLKVHLETKTVSP